MICPPITLGEDEASPIMEEDTVSNAEPAAIMPQNPLWSLHVQSSSQVRGRVICMFDGLKKNKETRSSGIDEEWMLMFGCGSVLYSPKVSYLNTQNGTFCLNKASRFQSVFTGYS